MPKSVLVAPNSFKGTLSSIEAARAIEGGIVAAQPGATVHSVPLADGGDGSLEVLAGLLGTRAVPEAVVVHGPLGHPVNARYLVEGGRGKAFVEMAQAVGLVLVHEVGADSALRASTRGVGELISHICRKHRPSELVVFLGGSATTDGGAGMAQALGFRLVDAGGADVPPGGGALGNIARIHRPTRNVVAGVSVLGLFDARFPLLGPNGAARRFAPQKGADPACVEVLEAGIANLALHFRTDLAVDVFSVPGGSAAGGIGAGLVAFLSATLAPGADYIMELAEFDRHLVGCDVVVTGEGRVDEQTPDGKVVGAVIQRAHAAGKPVILFAGRAEPGWEVMRRTGEVELRVTSAGGSVPRREEAAQILQFAAASAFDERGT